MLLLKVSNVKYVLLIKCCWKLPSFFSHLYHSCHDFIQIEYNHTCLYVFFYSLLKKRNHASYLSHSFHQQITYTKNINLGKYNYSYFKSAHTQVALKINPNYTHKNEPLGNQTYSHPTKTHTQMSLLLISRRRRGDENYW